MMWRLWSGVRSVHVDRPAAGAHERSSSVGRDTAGLSPGVRRHRVRQQPGHAHSVPAHPLGPGQLTHTHTPETHKQIEVLLFHSSVLTVCLLFLTVRDAAHQPSAHTHPCHHVCVLRRHAACWKPAECHCVQLRTRADQRHGMKQH